jgi:glutathione S-transferase
MGIQPVVYGAPYSVYVRAVRLALEEKGVPYRLVPVDVFAPDGPPKEYFIRQPFGRIPAFEHGGFQLYEAGLSHGMSMRRFRAPFCSRRRLNYEPERIR